MKKIFIPFPIYFKVSILITAIIFCFIGGYDIGAARDNKLWEIVPDVMVEVHGFFLDMVLVIIILGYFQLKNEESENIKNELKTIDNLRGSETPEAMLKIVATIKRLNKLGVTEINLSNCYLLNADLSDINLKGAYMRDVNLQESHLFSTILDDATLIGAKFQKSILSHTQFNNANLHAANFQSAEGLSACFQNAKLWRAVFKDVNMRYCEFEGAKFGVTNFQNAELDCSCVDNDFFFNASKNKLIGMSHLIEKYQIDDFGILRKRDQPTPFSI